MFHSKKDARKENYDLRDNLKSTKYFEGQRGTFTAVINWSSKR